VQPTRSFRAENQKNHEKNFVKSKERGPQCIVSGISIASEKWKTIASLWMKPATPQTNEGQGWLHELGPQNRKLDSFAPTPNVTKERAKR